MMAAFYPFLKPQALKQKNQIIKDNILVTATTQNQTKNLLQPAHAYGAIPASFTTVLISLPPRPERLTGMMSWRCIMLFLKQLTACGSCAWVAQ